MQLCKVSELVKAVRALLDEGDGKELNSLDDTETLRLDEIIRSRLIESTRHTLATAPLSMIGAGLEFGETIHWYKQEGHGAGYVLLPKDFLRLVTFQMSDWMKEVHDPIAVTSQEYLLQRSRFSGVRGCPERPVTAIINQPQGMALEFFSCTGGDGTYVRQAQYIPYPRIIKKRIYVPPLCQRSVIIRTAYLTAVTMRRETLAKRLLQNNRNILNDQLANEHT